MCSKVHGLIFLFKWEKNIETDDERPVVEDADGVFFARQVRVCCDYCLDLVVLCLIRWKAETFSN